MSSSSASLESLATVFPGMDPDAAKAADKVAHFLRSPQLYHALAKINAAVRQKAQANGMRYERALHDTLREIESGAWDRARGRRVSATFADPVILTKPPGAGDGIVDKDTFLGYLSAGRPLVDYAAYKAHGAHMHRLQWAAVALHLGLHDAVNVYVSLGDPRGVKSIAKLGSAEQFVTAWDRTSDLFTPNSPATNALKSQAVKRAFPPSRDGRSPEWLTEVIGATKDTSLLALKRALEDEALARSVDEYPSEAVVIDRLMGTSVSRIPGGLATRIGRSSPLRTKTLAPYND